MAKFRYFYLKHYLFGIIVALIFALLTFVYAYYIQKPQEVRIGFGALPGNCNTDLVVNVADYVLMSKTFLKVPGDVGYNALCNFNSQAIVDLSDYAILSANFGRTDTGGSPTSTPPPVGGSTAVIVAAGDIVCGTGSGGASCKQMETSNLIGQINPNAVLLLGDNQYEQGSLSDFQNYYNPSWGRFKSITKPAVGNHEYLTSGASGYFDYFGSAAGERSKGYYAYDLGSWRMYAINTQLCGGEQGSGCSRSSAQAQWLLQDLQQSVQRGIRCQLVYFHHPLWTSGSRASNSTRPLYQIMYENKVEVALAGHEHNYERFAPMDANGTRVSGGVRQIIVGTGGRNFTRFTNNAANSEVRNDNTFGVLKMTLKPTSYDLNFVPIAGSSFSDSLTNQACN